MHLIGCQWALQTPCMCVLCVISVCMPICDFKWVYVTWMGRIIGMIDGWREPCIHMLKYICIYVLGICSLRTYTVTVHACDTLRVVTGRHAYTVYTDGYTMYMNE